MKPNYPGYLIPENPQPEGFICLKVYIPADDYYLYAFSGAFQFFGKWLAWERDAGHNASLAAAAWRAAIQKTFDEAWLNCGDDVEDCCELIPGIIARIEELENMNINVNCGCGCGCPQAPPATPPGPTDLPPIVVSPIPTPDDDIGLLWKCNMSHYTAYLWRLWGIYCTANMATATIAEIENNYLNLGLTPPGYAARWATVTTAILNMGGIDGLPLVYDPQYEVIVCAIYRAPTAAAAADNLRQICATGGLGAWGDGMAWLADLLPIEACFTPQATMANLPPSYRDRDCSDCTSPVPPTDGEWFFVPGILASPYPTVTNDVSGFNMAGTATRGSSTDISLNASYEPYDEDTETTLLTAVAFTIVTITESPAVTPDANNGWFFGGEGARTYIGDYIPGDTVLIHLASHTQPDAGLFDHVISVSNTDYLVCRFGFVVYGYLPDARVIDLEIADFEVRTT